MTEAIASHLMPAHQRVADIVRRERVLVLIGCSLVGLHLVDDNFLQPQPGTSAGDHLVSGLVPLALVAAATLAYGRVRPGARAALALLLGYFGVLIGTEAAYYTADGGRSGDDYTGLLSLLTGVLLLGAGTVITGSTPLYDLPNGRIIRPDDGQPIVVPEGAVVVPGARAVTAGEGPAWGLSLATPVIVKYRDARTDTRTELERWIR